MEENIKEESGGVFIRNALYVLRRNLILMLVIVILVTACGTAYAFTRNPKYTASYHVSFSAQSKTANGETTSNYNATSAYIDTIVDFCNQGNVVDRANYYYQQWLSEKADGTTFEDFVGNGDNLSAVEPLQNPNSQDGTYEYEVGMIDDVSRTYNSGFLSDETYYDRSSISTETQAVKEETLRVFYIQYMDADPTVAKEKVTILFIAFVHEITAIDEEDPTKGKYFDDITPVIHDLHYSDSKEDITKFAIILIAFVIGAVLAIAVAYVKNMLDNTVKNRQELEMLSGTQVLATIGLAKENKHGKQE